MEAESFCADVWGLAVTHHHKDHTGGIETVLSAFPTASLVAHADEKPFLLDGISTGTLPSTNRGFRLMAALGLFANKKPAWPADRVRNALLGICPHLQKFPTSTVWSFDKVPSGPSRDSSP